MCTSIMGAVTLVRTCGRSVAIQSIHKYGTVPSVSHRDNEMCAVGNWTRNKRKVVCIWEQLEMWRPSSSGDPPLATHWPVPRSPKPESPCILQPSSCKLPCQITSNYAPKSSSTQINTVVLFSPNSNFYYLNSHRLIQAQSTYHSVQRKACCMVHALDRSQNRMNQLRPRNQKSYWIFTKIISHVASIQTKTRRASSSLACRERTSALPPTIRAAPSGGLRLSRLVYLGHLHGNTLTTLRWSH